MKPLRPFLMEDHLESHRFTARFNLGESGARPRSVRELLADAGVDASRAAAMLLELSLRDSPNWGRDDLREAVASFHPGATREDVLITTGTSEALLLLFRRLAPHKVALALPAFQLLYEIPLALGAEIVGLPVTWDHAGRPLADADEWADILEKERPDVVVLNNPHNPSGLVFPSVFADVVRAHVDAHGAALVCDEHYRFLSSESDILGPTHYRNDGRTYVTGSFTKCLGAPGLRIGWCVGPRAVLADMQGEKNYTTHTVNPMSEAIAHAVLTSPSFASFERAHAEWQTNRASLADVLSRPGTPLVGAAPAGGLVTVIGVRDLFTRAGFNVFHADLLREGIFTLPLSSMEFGTVFGGRGGTPVSEGAGVRVGLGMEPGRFLEALALLESVVVRHVRS